MSEKYTAKIPCARTKVRSAGVGHRRRPVKQDGKKGGNLKLEWSKCALSAPKYNDLLSIVEVIMLRTILLY